MHRAVAACIVAMSVSMSAVEAAPAPPGARVDPLAFADLPGWADDDHRAAFKTFLLSCDALRAETPALRLAQPPTAVLRQVCEAARSVDDSGSAARRFFETAFTPYRIVPESGAGFLTGYYEPEIEGALAPADGLTAPVYARPPDLVTLPAGHMTPGLDAALAAARRGPDGRLTPYPTRSDIYAGALAGQGLEILYLRDEPEVFIVQVQGSARVRLADGQRKRLVYAGRNGHPYTSIGRILVNENRIAMADMSLERLMGWLRANPQEAVRVMTANASYVFFALKDEVDSAAGPIGGAGVALTTGRSLAVDRGIWSYGLPVWCTADVATLPPPERAIRRLMIAQDTGSAIVGPARADFFWGTGAAAGRSAGLTRHALDFVVLWPNAAP